MPAADPDTGGAEGIARALFLIPHLCPTEQQRPGDIGIAQVNRTLEVEAAEPYPTRRLEPNAVKGEVPLVYTLNKGALAYEAAGDVSIA